jgi:hypothetical protein
MYFHTITNKLSLVSKKFKHNSSKSLEVLRIIYVTFKKEFET